MGSLKIDFVFWIKVLLLGSLISTIMLSLLMKEGQPCFPDTLPKNFATDAYIIALEFADTTSEFEQILASTATDCEAQTGDRISFLKTSVLWDYGYIVSYGLLFLFLILNLAIKEIRLIHKVLLVLVPLVCLLDVGENIFLFKALEHFESPIQNIDQVIMLMFHFAVLKWAFLFFFILGVLVLITVRMHASIKNLLVIIYFILIGLYAVIPFSKLPYVGNAVQLIILASVPILLWGLIYAFLNKPGESRE